MKDITREEFIGLLEKHLRGEASVEEQELLTAYYEIFEIRPNILDSHTDDYALQIESEIKKRIDENIVNLATPARRIGIRRLVAASIAAAAVSIGALLLFDGPEDPKVRPGSFSADNSMRATLRTNIIELPDGSMVTLEPGSQLRYSPSFLDSSREVYLDGQAYFDVKQLPQKPFIVHAGNLKTTVLGTAFNIKALSGDTSVVVTVTKGKVKLSDAHKTLAVLIPDEQAVYHKVNAEASKAKVSAAKATAWIKGDLILDNITVQNAAIVIGERFDVDIEIVDEQLKGLRFTTSLNMDDSLETIIKSIAQFNDASYYIDKEKKHVSILMTKR